MGEVSLTALEDEWLRKATSAAIASARKVVTDGALPSGTPIGRLSDVEWGWITTAILFGWISTRAEQATSFGIDAELTVRMTGQDPDPWDAGAVATILPDLAQSVKVDWSKPLNDWSREIMVEFLLTAFTLMRKAMNARDAGCPVIKKAKVS
jgi:hypothetical protein